MKNKLLNPFAYYDEKILFAIGIVSHFFFTYIGYLTKSNFPDFLSIKKSVETFSFLELIVQNSTILLVTIFCLFLLGKIINKKTRFIDIVNVALVSRIAYYVVFITDFIPVVNRKLELVLHGVTENNFDVLNDITTMTVVLLVAFTAIFFLLLMFYYLFIGFKTVTNLKSIKHILLFIGCLFLIEIITSSITIIKYNIL